VVIVATGVLAVLVAAGLVVSLPVPFDLIRRLAWISWLMASAWLIVVALVRNRAALLWRVRRKLLLSYFFFGLVPVVLIVAFVLAAAVLLYVTVASYVFRESYGDAILQARNIAEASAVEAARTPMQAAAGLERRYENLRGRFPGLSLAVVPVAPGLSPAQIAAATIVAGAWEHAEPPRRIPEWVVAAGGTEGTLVTVRGQGAPAELVVRAAVPTADGLRMAITDVPVSAELLEATRTDTGVTLESFSASGCGVDVVATVPADDWSLFRRTVTFVDCIDWEAGTTGRLSFNLVAPVTDLYQRLSALQSAAAGASTTDWGRVLLQLLWLLGGLFLVVQASAIVMGVLLARSITSAIHELFEGTERIRIGDFAHRIHIASKDQLGKLAESFNGMSESIERLLHVEREKQRLDDELRIARQIQMSLLPVRPPAVASLDVADLCEPARAVGGDYYDFFDLGDNRLGVLVADVAGKGTSAALYMAELKGIMVALSRADASPGAVLCRVNRLLVGQLDNRSFITMAYAVIDPVRGVVTVARAGHSPMIVASPGRADIVAPEGMVLGLRLPGAEDLFERVLEEREVPIAPGEVIVFYTDGVTEATAPDGDMFGDDRLARLVAGTSHLSAAGIRERVVRDIRAFTGPGEAHDDMTMVIVKLEGGAA
jgi:sigma-B regulation protein RsbU (phosphoserine phosphatase)